MNSLEEPEDIPEEYVMDEIVYFEVNQSIRNRYAKYGKNLYMVRWHGFGPEEDTWEPTHHLPRRKIITSHLKLEQPIPSNINNAVNG